MIEPADQSSDIPTCPHCDAEIGIDDEVSDALDDWHAASQRSVEGTWTFICGECGADYTVEYGIDEAGAEYIRIVA